MVCVTYEMQPEISTRLPPKTQSGVETTVAATTNTNGDKRINSCTKQKSTFYKIQSLTRSFGIIQEFPTYETP